MQAFIIYLYDLFTEQCESPRTEKLWATCALSSRGNVEIKTVSESCRVPLLLRGTRTRACIRSHSLSHVICFSIFITVLHKHEVHLIRATNRRCLIPRLLSLPCPLPVFSDDGLFSLSLAGQRFAEKWPGSVPRLRSQHLLK